MISRLAPCCILALYGFRHGRLPADNSPYFMSSLLGFVSHKFFLRYCLEGGQMLIFAILNIKKAFREKNRELVIQGFVFFS